MSPEDGSKADLTRPDCTSYLLLILLPAAEAYVLEEEVDLAGSSESFALDLSRSFLTMRLSRCSHSVALGICLSLHPSLSGRRHSKVMCRLVSPSSRQ